MYICKRTLHCGGNANKHALCSSTSYLVCSHLFVVVVVVVVIGGGVTPLVQDCQDHCNSDIQ